MPKITQPAEGDGMRLYKVTPQPTNPDSASSGLSAVLQSPTPAEGSMSQLRHKIPQSEQGHSSLCSSDEMLTFHGNIKKFKHSVGRWGGHKASSSLPEPCPNSEHAGQAAGICFIINQHHSLWLAWREAAGGRGFGSEGGDKSPQVRKSWENF